METLRLSRATHQLIERGVEALEKIVANWSGTMIAKSGLTVLTRDANSSSG